LFHLLHCNHCGKEKRISLEEISTLHAQHKRDFGPNKPNGDSSEKSDQIDQPNPYDVPMNHKEIEKLLPHCTCGGKFTFDASPRCPKCGSTDFRKISGMYTLYD
jgi:hypothetical protein